MSNFEAAYKVVAENEGIFANIPYDKGGKTKYGITEATLEAYKKLIFAIPYDRKIEDLTLEESKLIFKYIWDSNKFDKIENQEVATKLYDMGIPMGMHQAFLYIQRALCCMCCQNAIKVDGILGPQTILAINSAVDSDKDSLLYLLRAFCVHHYSMMKYINPKLYEICKNGWFKRAYQ